jgi:hypothetical protein
VKQVIICTPDKDLSQCVVGPRVVQLDRRRDILRDEAGVVAKFGVSPQSIPDLVGDPADGFPGRPDGAKKLRLSPYLGKMIGLQTIAIAAGATGLSALERGKLFRFTLRQSVILLLAGGLIAPCLHLCFLA